MMVFMAFYAIFVGVLYGQQRRWSAALGWLLFVGGIVALSVGLGSTFPWGGLAFMFVSAAGVLLIMLDLASRRARRQSRR